MSGRYLSSGLISEVRVVSERGDDGKHLTLAFVLIMIAFAALLAAKCDISGLQRRVDALEQQVRQ